MSYRIIITKKAAKEMINLTSAGLKPKAQQLLDLIRQDPYSPYPHYEKLNGDMEGMYSRRINIQHRMVYEVDEKQKQINIIRMWSHYE